MKPTQPTMVYRPLLRQAWQKTWQRKSLWVFGLFAALLMNGGVFDAFLRSLHRIERTGQLFTDLLSDSVFGFQLFGAYLTQIHTFNQTRVFLFITLLILFVIGLFATSLLSQHALIQGIGSTKPLEPKALRHHAFQGFWDILAINFFVKTASLILTFLCALILIGVFVGSSSWTPLLLFLVFLVFIPLIILINIIGILALIVIVQKKTHALNALHTAFYLFSQHGLATLEFGLSLFLLVFGAGALLLILSVFLLLPFWMLTLAALTYGSLTIYILLNIIVVIFFFSLFLLFIALSTTFHYASWVGFYTRITHKTFGSKVVSKLLRIVT
ncbi:hypothetical protein A2239_03850 [Candidatus Uhrbacteria bacterium RIFOXYA2_FULL_40_9]|nr:MAG: putative membrane protein [Candidatus Uhrbacteria bacterium GW2011_GWF2_40_263]OGL93877.1 MAG: hypothetical protein A2239_03850 [Candidatus Uhrbacteria bacterium RIFOXYA2_FULL_40_9]OGL97785.1 MAG: hypothetical protein A2332_02450 [Candidatus Uhrbacteria bacterium RIFOXYB2_FULL_41_18]HBK35184.1 hypothetical protein [Candidatus Uhrbacteria bacterium]HCB55810.1 hypothetical protein [Candidatus Uhrbacteria bacterium]